MKIIEPSYEILTPISDGGIEELKRIERAARTCYKSEDKMTDDGESAKKIVKMLVEHGHDAMLEHSSLTVRFITDRGVSHELVRHRLAAYAQESTRYCSYDKGKFGGEITVVRPSNIERVSYAYSVWSVACRRAEEAYMELLDDGCKPQDARSVLPTSLKTEIVVTANYREWRHILALRTDKAAHPDIRALLTPLLAELQKRIPIVFDGIGNED
jgi:thymidylate synthase (FAD)